MSATGGAIRTSSSAKPFLSPESRWCIDFCIPQTQPKRFFTASDMTVRPCVLNLGRFMTKSDSATALEMRTPFLVTLPAGSRRSSLAPPARTASRRPVTSQTRRMSCIQFGLSPTKTSPPASLKILETAVTSAGSEVMPIEGGYAPSMLGFMRTRAPLTAERSKPASSIALLREESSPGDS